MPGLNDYVNACRHNKYAGAKLKKDAETLIEWYIKSQLAGVHIDKPVEINFLWLEENRKRDLDNIYSAKKYILDALVRTKVLQNDTQKWVVELADSHVIGRGVGCVVEIEEVEE